MQGQISRFTEEERVHLLTATCFSPVEGSRGSSQMRNAEHRSFFSRVRPGLCRRGHVAVASGSVHSSPLGSLRIAPARQSRLQASHSSILPQIMLVVGLLVSCCLRGRRKEEEEAFRLARSLTDFRSVFVEDGNSSDGTNCIHTEREYLRDGLGYCWHSYRRRRQAKRHLDY